ncbi:hypothetical protein B7P43_G12620, partial [Cryptotermes secundus]
MEVQRSPENVMKAKLPPCHEIQDLVDELLVTPWDTRDTSSSSSDSLSPRAPLADISSELQDFSAEETYTLFQEALKHVEISDSIKEDVEMEDEEYHGINKNKNSQMTVVSDSSEIEGNKGKMSQEENTEKTLMITELEENEYRWKIKNNEKSLATFDFLREEREGVLQNNTERAVVILKAEEEDYTYETLTGVCDTDQDMMISEADTEHCEGRIQEYKKERAGTFSEKQKKGRDVGNLENEELLSGAATKGSLCEVIEEGEEDNGADTEYPASVSNMRGPHRRTMA